MKSGHRITLLAALWILVLWLPSVVAQENEPEETQPAGQVLELIPEVISVRSHDTSAFTQGFLLYEGTLYESTGQYGRSTLRQVDPETGEVLRMVPVPDEFFAEGLVRVGNRLIQLTWTNEQAFVYDLETFEQIDTLSYDGEGWGLCSDGDFLYMSDGSPFLSLRHLETFELIFREIVLFQDSPVNRLNELECVGDYIYANVWQTDFIVQIRKNTGMITAVIDASGLLTPAEIAQMGTQAVLNGIAYNAETDTFLITGKNWPKMFEVRFVERETAATE
jgi:glutamine cyclotransferase